MKTFLLGLGSEVMNLEGSPWRMLGSRLYDGVDESWWVRDYLVIVSNSWLVIIWQESLHNYTQWSQYAIITTNQRGTNIIFNECQHQLYDVQWEKSWMNSRHSLFFILQHTKKWEYEVGEYFWIILCSISSFWLSFFSQPFC